MFGLGASWRSHLAGWILIVGDIILFTADVVNKQGLPDTLVEWGLFAGILVTGIAKLFQKDGNVSNSQHPAAPAVVPPTALATPNPSAEVK